LAPCLLATKSSPPLGGIKKGSQGIQRNLYKKESLIRHTDQGTLYLKCDNAADSALFEVPYGGGAKFHAATVELNLLVLILKKKIRISQNPPAVGAMQNTSCSADYYIEVPVSEIRGGEGSF